MPIRKEVVFKPVALRCGYVKDPIGIQLSTPGLSWACDHPGKGACQKAWQIVASSTMGRMREGEYDLWDSGIVPGDRHWDIRYGGNTLTSGQQVFWKVRVWDDGGHVSPFSEIARFETGLLHRTDWKGQWMGFLGGMIGNGIQMRYSFRTRTGHTKARVYVCGIGYCEFRLNGRKVGDKLLDPGATDYSKTLLYSTYDISELLTEGLNTIGIVLGTGWSGTPKVICQINIEYEDGETQQVCTDWGIGWCVARGPITYNSIYDGEDYDARLEKDGWDTPAYEETFEREHQRPGGWILATVVEPPGGELIGEILPPIRVTETKTPVLMRVLPDGRELYDNGINIAGWVRTLVHGERGSSIQITFSEVLDNTGDLDMSYLRTARCQDSYTLRGDRATEEFAPRFTYHGFRYFTIRTSGHIVIDRIMSEFVRSDLEKNATFHCSDAFVNELAQVMWHTDACNLHSIPTDCCQRDERHGWTTDMTSRAEGCLYHFDMAAFFDKWIRDVFDTQDENGYFADTAPFRWGRRPCDPQVNTPVSLPLLLYRAYGNKARVREYFPRLVKYIDALLDEADGWLISRTGFGEWACPKAECFPEPFGAGAVSRNVTPTLVSTGYLYRSVMQMWEMADILDDGKAADLYAGIAEQIKSSFNSRFLNPETLQYDMGSQSANALALDLKLVPENIRDGVTQNIVSNVESNDFHLTTGNMGTKAIIEVLSENGMEDLVYKVMTQTSSPGFGYMLASGATSIWERWEADRDNNIMNSHNHPMLSACCTWFYKYLGGIRMAKEAASFQQIEIAPTAPAGISHACASMEVMAGRISTEWWRLSDGFRLKLSIPFNTEAVVTIPNRYAPTGASMHEGNQRLSLLPESKWPDGIRDVAGNDTEYQLRIGSGSYDFSLKQ